MSDDKTNDLRDDLEDMIGDAKEGARKAAAKAEEIGREAKEKASEFAKEAKEKADEFAGEAKEKASEFANDAKKVLSDGKNVAIVAHLTIIGWIIALVMNNDKNNDFAAFYIRQMLGIMIIAVLITWIPFFGWLAAIILFVFWIMSLISAIGGEKKEIPVLGSYFQDWFKSIQ